MNIIVKMGTDESKINEFLDVLTVYTNVKWRGDEFCPKGYAPNDPDEFHIDIALKLFDAYYFIVEDDILCWDDESVIHAIPTDKFDKYESLDEVIKDIKKNNKLNIRNAVIKATDDKYGRILVNFLRILIHYHTIGYLYVLLLFHLYKHLYPKTFYYLLL